MQHQSTGILLQFSKGPPKKMVDFTSEFYYNVAMRQ